jgi:hypothetical protein
MSLLETKTVKCKRSYYKFPTVCWHERTLGVIISLSARNMTFLPKIQTNKTRRRNRTGATMFQTECGEWLGSLHLLGGAERVRVPSFERRILRRHATHMRRQIMVTYAKNPKRIAGTNQRPK